MPQPPELEFKGVGTPQDLRDLAGLLEAAGITFGAVAADAKPRKGAEAVIATITVGVPAAVAASREFRRLLTVWLDRPREVHVELTQVDNTGAAHVMKIDLSDTRPSRAHEVVGGLVNGWGTGQSESPGSPNHPSGADQGP